MFKVFSKNNQTQNICEIAVISALWIVLSYISLAFRPLIFNGLFPVFYFLVWISGLFFSPQKAFVTTFIGHFLFDVFIFFNIFFIFIWFASGLSSFLISILKWNTFFLSVAAFFLMPLIYFFAFFTIGSIFFPNPIAYFVTYPGLTFALFFVNPVFNSLVFYYFVKPNFSLKKINKIITVY